MGYNPSSQCKQTSINVRTHTEQKTLFYYFPRLFNIQTISCRIFPKSWEGCSWLHELSCISHKISSRPFDLFCHGRPLIWPKVHTRNSRLISGRLMSKLRDDHEKVLNFDRSYFLPWKQPTWDKACRSRIRHYLIKLKIQGKNNNGPIFTSRRYRV